MRNNQPQHIYSVQFLRFVAAMGVAAQHAFVFTDLNLTALPPALVHASEAGAAGVHVFFVVSGFIMVWTTQGRFGQASYIRPFLEKRFVRIFPTYWFLAAVSFAIIAATGSVQARGVGETLAGLFLLPGHSSDFIFVGWTLTYELFFYAVFAVFISLGRITAAVGMTILFFLLVVIGALFDFNSPTFEVVTNSLLLEFIMGVWVAIFVIEDIAVPKRLLAAGVFVSIAAFVATALTDFTKFPSVIYWGLPSAALVAAMVLLEKRWTLPRFVKDLSFLGDSSYSLYLAHALIIPPVTLGLARLFDYSLFSAIVVAVLLTIFCVVISHLIYLVCERPLIRAARSLIFRLPR